MATVFCSHRFEGISDAMNFIDCDFEEERWLDIALKHCVDLERILLLSILKVEMLKSKCGARDDTSIRSAVAVHSLRIFLTPLDDVPMATYPLERRSLRNIWDTSSNLAVQAMKIRSIADSLVRRVERLLLKYRNREYHQNDCTQLSPYLPASARRCH